MGARAFGGTQPGNERSDEGCRLERAGTGADRDCGGRKLLRLRTVWQVLGAERWLGSGWCGNDGNLCGAGRVADCCAHTDCSCSDGGDSGAAMLTSGSLPVLGGRRIFSVFAVSAARLL